MNSEFEKLIDAIVADGLVTSKEKKVLYSAADRLGIDRETADVLLDGALERSLNAPETVETRSGTSRPTECGSCGARLEAHSTKCVFCGAEQRFHENTGGDFIKSLQAALVAATREQDKIDNAKSGFKASMEAPGIALARRQAGVIASFDLPTETKSQLAFFLHCDANAEADLMWNRQRGGPEDILKAAWKSKATMAYSQLELVGSGDAGIAETLTRYGSRYATASTSIERTERARKIKKRVLWGVSIVCAAGFILFPFFGVGLIIKDVVDGERLKAAGEIVVESPNDEIRRLGNLQEEIQDDIQAGRFSDARARLPQLRYTFPLYGWEEEAEYNSRVSRFDEMRREYLDTIEKLESSAPNQRSVSNEERTPGAALNPQSDETFESLLKKGLPFGIRAGTMIEEFGSTAEHIETTDTGESYYLLETVPVEDPDFIHYSLEVSKDGGVTKVIAAIIKGSFLGDAGAVGEVYSEWDERLSGVLGPKASDPRSVGKLGDMESEYLSAWTSQTGADLPQVICRVSLYSEVFEDVFEGAFEGGSIPGLVLVFSFEKSNHCD